MNIITAVSRNFITHAPWARQIQSFQLEELTFGELASLAREVAGTERMEEQDQPSEVGNLVKELTESETV